MDLLDCFDILKTEENKQNKVDELESESVQQQILLNPTWLSRVSNIHIRRWKGAIPLQKPDPLFVMLDFYFFQFLGPFWILATSALAAFQTHQVRIHRKYSTQSVSTL